MTVYYRLSEGMQVVFRKEFLQLAGEEYSKENNHNPEKSSDFSFFAIVNDQIYNLYNCDLDFLLKSIYVQFLANAASKLYHRISTCELSQR